MGERGHSDDRQSSRLDSVGFQRKTNNENDHSDQKHIEDQRLQKKIAILGISNCREQFFNLDDEFALEKMDSDEMG
jgi:hypothetical protein